MPVDRITSKFEKNHAQAQRSAREQLKFILANKRALLSVKNGARKYDVALQLSTWLDKFTETEMSRIDALYESTMKGMGFESVGTHHDKPRANLRHPQ